MYVCMYLCRYENVSMHACMYVCAYMYIYISIYTYGYVDELGRQHVIPSIRLQLKAPPFHICYDEGTRQRSLCRKPLVSSFTAVRVAFLMLSELRPELHSQSEALLWSAADPVRSLF